MISPCVHYYIKNGPFVIIQNGCDHSRLVNLYLYILNTGKLLPSGHISFLTNVHFVIIIHEHINSTPVIQVAPIFILIMILHVPQHLAYCLHLCFYFSASKGFGFQFG